MSEARPLVPTSSQLVPDDVPDLVPLVPPVGDEDEDEGRDDLQPKPYGDEEWKARLQRSVEATLRRRQGRRDTQAAHKAGRDHGLAQRHAAKLARADERLRQAQHDGIHDSWFEEDQ